MRTLMLVLTLLGMVRTAAAGTLTNTDPRLLTVSWDLLASSKYGHSSREHAAFLVRDADGGLRLVRWTWGAEALRASYRGAIPEGTVAIVHTHPNRVPNPSHDDELTARRLGMPVYVLTRSNVTRTDGARTEVVAWGDWKPAR